MIQSGNERKFRAGNQEIGFRVPKGRNGACFSLVSCSLTSTTGLWLLSPSGLPKPVPWPGAALGASAPQVLLERGSRSLDARFSAGLLVWDCLGSSARSLRSLLSLFQGLIVAPAQDKKHSQTHPTVVAQPWDNAPENCPRTGHLAVASDGLRL